jgi:hypothetical protein
MAGVPAGLPAGVRVSDHISLGVIAKTFPPDLAQIASRFRWVQQVLAETGKASERARATCRRR